MKLSKKAASQIRNDVAKSNSMLEQLNSYDKDFGSDHSEMKSELISSISFQLEIIQQGASSIAKPKKAKKKQTYAKPKMEPDKK